MGADIVGNKAKGLIAKQVLQQKKARQIFRKTNISENLECFFFLLPPFWDLPFCLITADIREGFS